MFFARLTTQKTFLKGIRFNSTTSAAKKSFGDRLSSLTSQTVYWSKVVAEVSKQVYSKEGLSPPSLKDFETVYKQLYQCALNAAKQPELFVSNAQKTFQSINKDCVIKYGSYTVQLFGLFALGEIIGRRQIFGYPEFGEAKHH